MEDTKNLNTSKLGTKQYWDEFYELEASNFQENPNDTGECWFSDNDAEEKMVEFLIDNLGELKISSSSSMIDLGTGNGHLLFQLYEEGFRGKLIGVDYSSQSTDFASQILESKYPDAENLTFQAADIFSSSWNPGKFDIILDKGTLDAIALSGIVSESGESIVQLYPRVVEELLEKDSVFLITSCNFTQDELIQIIESEVLKVWKTINYPAFEFGGIKGASICSVAFVKK